MKASELAALLLQNPDADVYVQTCHSSIYGDWYNLAESCNGITSTPSGTFIDISSVPREMDIKKPCDIPLIGASRIKLDSTVHDFLPVTRDYDDYISDLDNGWFWTELKTEGYYYSFISDSENVIFNYNAEYQTDYQVQDEHVYTVDDVQYVEVLTELDSEWNETWTRMSFEEAYERFTKDDTVSE